MPSLLPGETATIREISTTAGYSTAVKLQQLQPPTAAVPPPCPYVDACGGCHLQHVSYPHQLALKHTLVVDALQRIANIKDAAHLVAPVVPSAAQLAYRNNMQFVWDPAQSALGLRPPGSNTETVALHACLLQPVPANTLLQACARLLRANPVASAAVERVTIRSAAPSDPNKLCFVVGFSTRVGGEGVRASLDECAQALRRQPLGGGVLQGVVWTLEQDGAGERRRHRVCVLHYYCNVCVFHHTTCPFRVQERPQQQQHRSTTVLYGSSLLHESRVGGPQMEIAFASFFQVNAPQANALFATVRRLAALQSDDTVLDLFCGAGAIGLSLAAHVAHVLGIDADGAAIQAAKDSAHCGRVDNATFYVADLTTIGDVLKSSQPVDVVIVDPPRAGLHARLVQWLCTSPAAANARCVVYVSCNPATLARDLGRMGKRWRVQAVVPVDMFPQTAHVEVVALLVPVVAL